MREIVGQLPRLLWVSLLCVLLMGAYCYVLTINDIIPLAGKKAPSFVIVLLLIKSFMTSLFFAKGHLKGRLYLFANLITIMNSSGLI